MGSIFSCYIFKYPAILDYKNNPIDTLLKRFHDLSQINTIEQRDVAIVEAWKRYNALPSLRSLREVKTINAIHGTTNKNIRVLASFNDIPKTTMKIIKSTVGLLLVKVELINAKIQIRGSDKLVPLTKYYLFENGTLKCEQCWALDTLLYNITSHYKFVRKLLDLPLELEETIIIGSLKLTVFYGGEGSDFIGAYRRGRLYYTKIDYSDHYDGKLEDSKWTLERIITNRAAKAHEIQRYFEQHYGVKIPLVIMGYL
jgi:hypothetical protein